MNGPIKPIQPIGPQSLANFLQSIGNDQALLQRYLSSPEDVMNEFNLSDEHKKLVVTGDKDGITTALQNDDGTSPVQAVYVLPVPIVY
ncbi:hypothetical protein [Rahnella sp. CJA17(1/100)]|uniref:hypothetical protein n=1 Tax=Rahnella sp. CJA17(1/100) TaxID=2508951 RepID=UPI00107027CE|nr:hypothetical protein [Rahnella sp. CJA17(1/100)]